jgi:hypothetical protein
MNDRRTDFDGTNDLFEVASETAPFDPLDFVFTAETIGGARYLASGLPGTGEVWELNGRYFVAARGSDEALLLERRGAHAVPEQDDDLHCGLDPILSALQRDR